MCTGVARLVAGTAVVAIGVAMPAHASTTALIDRFLLLRNTPPATALGGLYADEFGNGLAPVHLVPEPIGGGAFANGVAGTYVVSGAFPPGAEAGGKLMLDPNAGALVSTATGTPFLRIGAILATDTDPATAIGLKPIHDFSVRARFDLVTPAAVADGYGIELNDTSPAGPGNDRLQFLVRRDTPGDDVFQLISQRFGTGGGVSFLATAPLAPPTGTTQLALQLNHSAAQVGVVSAAYLYINSLGNVYDPVGGMFTSVPSASFDADVYRTVLAGTGQIFVDNEGFARSGFLAVQLVPEPGTYAMLLAGLGVLGWFARRRVRG